MVYDKFSAKAAIYDKYRPRYSKEFIDYIYNNYGITDKSVIADIGAGTGILSEEFLVRNSEVICVEPNIQMLEQARKRLSKYAKVSFINSSAEDTNIFDQSINIIIVGQAFHWFNKIEFLKECKRIIVDNGFVVLAWNISNSSNIVSKEIFDLNSKCIKRYNGYNLRDQENDQEYYDFFLNGEFVSHNFENNLFLNNEEFIGRCLSRSYSPDIGDDNYEEYVDGLNTIFDTYSEKGKIKIINTTKCVIGRVK